MDMTLQAIAKGCRNGDPAGLSENGGGVAECFDRCLISQIGVGFVQLQVREVVSEAEN